MLAPGYGSASPTSVPTATMGVGHSAKSFFAAPMSDVTAGSTASDGNVPAVTTSRSHYDAICGRAP